MSPDPSLDNLLSKVGAATIQDARTLAASRADAEKKADLAQAVLDTLAPQGIEVLHAAKADADLAATGAHDEQMPAIADLESHLTKAEEGEGLARRHLSGVDADQASAREETVKLQAAAETAQILLDRAKADAGPMETSDDRRAELLRLQAQWQVALSKAEADLKALLETAPDVNGRVKVSQRAAQNVATLGWV